MYSSNSKIRYHKTAVDEKNEYSEYCVYEKDGLFIAECIGWRIKDFTRTGGSRDYYQEFETEEDAITKYDELLKAREA